MSPIVWELGLVIGGLVAFVVWQTVTLRRDVRLTQREKAERAAHERAANAAADREPTPPA